MPASENDHSNFRIYSLSLPTGTLAVIKRGVYKSSLFIFHRKLYSVQSASQKLLRINVTPDLHLTYSKNGGNLGLVLKMKNIA